MKQAIDELSNDKNEDRYNLDVWLSGAHMRSAEMLRADNPDSSEKHLEKAGEIIKSNDELVLRAKQLENLSSTLK